MKNKNNEETKKQTIIQEVHVHNNGNFNSNSQNLPNGYGKAAFTLGLLGFLFSMSGTFGVLLSALGIIFAIVQLVRNNGVKTLAIWGLCLGAIGFLCSLAWASVWSTVFL